MQEFTIMRARRTTGGEYVILCHLPENKVTPWVTWRAATVDGQGAYRGNYFYANEETFAYEDFNTRT
jgi:hypothetical protein